MNSERPLTQGPGGRILTNVNVWSPDSEWIAFDPRSDAAGERFDGDTIQMVHLKSREVRTVYRSQHGANCGVVTWHPHELKLVFIHGPELPTPEWNYSASRRQGVLLEVESGRFQTLDARDLVPPFTAGALRGGTHVHVFHPHGELVSSTYEDEFLRQREADPRVERNQRNLAVHWLGQPVTVPRTHPRNQDGESFSVVVTRTQDEPRPGSDDISRAYEEGWIGNSHSLAFQGLVRGRDGTSFAEVFRVDLPEALDQLRQLPLMSEQRRLEPPARVRQRRLTDTSQHRYPGLSGPRHWLRSDPTGSRIGLLKRDEAGVVQFWTLDLNSLELRQMSRGEAPIQSAFTWHPDGERVALIRGGQVGLLHSGTGEFQPLTVASDPPPRPEACVVSPDGQWIAFVRHQEGVNQIHACRVTAASGS